MLKEYHGDTLYCLEYLTVMLVPILVALIDSGIKSFEIVLPVMGWVFLAISMNLMNDFFDKNRALKITGKSLMVLSLFLMFMGFYCVWSHSLWFAIGYTILMIAYNIKLKDVAIVENFLQVFVYGILPYFAFATKPSVWSLLILIFAGVTAELAHHVADREATFKLLKEKGSLYATLIFSILFFLSCILYLVFGPHKFYAALIIVALGGVIHTIRTLYGSETIENWVKVKKL